MAEKTILVVDDEVHIVEMLAMSMKIYGFRCIAAHSGEQALELARSQLPDLILLDLMLPGIDGIETCRRLKLDRTLRRIPVIMLTAKSQEADKIVGLGSGADDYVTKPFGIGELFARVAVALRRLENSPFEEDPREDVLIVGDIYINCAARNVQVGEDVVRLTLSEYRLLLLLAERSGSVVEREELCHALSTENRPCSGRTIDVHIRNLRKKLFDMGGSTCIIETVRGVGYRL